MLHLIFLENFEEQPIITKRTTKDIRIHKKCTNFIKQLYSLNYYGMDDANDVVELNDSNDTKNTTFSNVKQH